MIWFAALIPLVFAISAFLFKNVFFWVRLIISSIVTFLLISLINGLTIYGLTADTEYWTNFLDSVAYFESWTEEEVIIGTDVNGNTTVDIDTTRHPAQYKGYIGKIEFNITSNQYQQIKYLWDNEKFYNLSRFGQISINDGDKYASFWNPNQIKGAIAVTTLHSYFNPVPKSNLNRFPKVSPEDVKNYHLFDYPKISNYTLSASSILGDNPPENIQQDLNYLNAKLGPIKQIKIWILVFNDQNQQVAKIQEAYWVGGNKNELVICIGLNDKKVAWCKPFSWCDKELPDTNRMYSTLINGIESQGVIEWDKTLQVIEDATQYWHRRSFSELDYVLIPIPIYVVVIAYLLAIVGNFVVFFVVDENAFQ